MRRLILCTLVFAAVAPTTPLHAQAARSNFVTMPRVLTSDTPRFHRLRSEQDFCVRDVKDKKRKRVAKAAFDERVPCKTE